MFGLFGGKKERAAETRLHAVVSAAMPGADGETVRLVTAIAGLLGTVAYADRRYAPEEEAHVRAALERLHGVDAAAVDAIAGAVREHLVELSTVEAPWYARTLRDLAERDLRLEVLEILVDLAAADDEVVLAETNLLRHTATALGLTQADYNEAQARHRAKLQILR